MACYSSGASAPPWCVGIKPPPTHRRDVVVCQLLAVCHALPRIDQLEVLPLLQLAGEDREAASAPQAMLASRLAAQSETGPAQPQDGSSGRRMLLPSAAGRHPA